MIRLIVLDLDQTVFGNDLVISPRVHRALDAARQRGADITIATGREARLATKFVPELNVSVPIIASQGGCIYDAASGRVLHDERLSPGVLPKVLQSAERHGWSLHMDAGDYLYFPQESDHPSALFELIRYSNWVRLGDLVKDLPEMPYKFVVTLKAVEDREQVLKEIETELAPEITPVASHPHLVEGLPAGVHKGHGLAWLAGHLGIDRSEVLAIGDSEADLPMLEWAGVGVAMGNAIESVKARANWVAPDLRQDGAAVAIERFVLGNC